MEQQSISSDLIRGHIDTIILHTLLDSDKFAQQISDMVEKKSDGVYKLNQATLYSSLKRLESLKFVLSYWQDSDNGGRRKFFKLTESGKKTVDDNMSSWSFSRGIIDKLIDCEPQPVYKTEYVEKIVQVPVERTVIKEVEVPVAQPVLTNEKDFVVNSVNQKSDSESQQDAAVQEEVNFRKILNGLITDSNSRKNKENSVEELRPIQKEDVDKNEVQSFNKTIDEPDYSITRHIGTIDFSDLVLKAATEGYKLRISSKNSTQNTGTLLVNKLNLFTSLSMFLLMLIQVLIFSVGYKSTLNPSTVLVLSIVGVLMIYPIISIIKYKNNPIKTISKRISADSILTTAIIIFNLLLINFACVLLFNLDFDNAKQLITYLIIPIVLYLDILIYSIINFYLGNSDSFILKNKKSI